MEGLIPMVYKAIKRNKTRRQYRCLSSASAAQTYNIADFYVTSQNYMLPSTNDDDDDDQRRSNYNYSATAAAGTTFSRSADDHQMSTNFNTSNGQHRRHKSMDPHHDPPKQQLVRFRSHRSSIFSCITTCSTA